MFLEELFHDTIELGKKRFNGYLLILIFGVRVDDLFPKRLLFLLVALLRSHLFFFGLRVGGFISCALPRVLLLLLLGTSLGHEAHGWRRKRALTCDGYSGDVFFIGRVFLFLFLLIFIVRGEPFTNISTPSALEILLLGERCLALVLALLSVLLGLGALG